MKSLLLLTLLAGTAIAQSATLTTTWTNPSQRTDGSALPSTAIASSTIEWGTCSGTAFGTMVGTANTSGAATTHVSPTVAPATYCVRVRTNAVTGGSSVWSNVATKTIDAAPPNAPVIVTVQQTAYELQRNWWWYRLAAVGTVALGEPCGAPLGKKYATLDTSQVTTGTRYRGGQLYGRCA